MWSYVREMNDGGGALEQVAHELIERFEAHLTAGGFYSVLANMRGSSPEDVAERILGCDLLRGLQGPTISPVYTSTNGRVTDHEFYAATICVPKKKLYACVKQLRKVGLFLLGARGICS
jgi:ATP phosphoribosyltransferase